MTLPRPRRRVLLAVFALCAAWPALGAPTDAAVAGEGQAEAGPLIEVAAFGVTPVAGVEPDETVQPRPGDILHRGEGEAPAEDPRVAVEARVRAGETWPELLERLNAPLPAALRPQLELLPALEPGKYVRAYAATRDRPAEIDYVVSDSQAYTITLRASFLQVVPHASDPRMAERIRADASKASLFTATDAIGLPDSIVLQLVEIFGGDVDFHRELHYGYRCTLVYEVYYRHGHIDRAGRILAAEFLIRGRRLQAYYFDDRAGHAGYYTESGRSMQKVFRRSPVQFSRITSEYTLARFHPILGVWRAHRGTDYAAPVGTPVLATAEGVVQFAGDRGEYGNLVILGHFGRYETYYGHLRGFARGVTEGAAVRRGQVIGYVGMTGLTTGPHVHFEFRVRDVNGDWVSVPEPATVEGPPVHTPQFFEAVKGYREKLALAARAHVVILD